MMSIRIFKDGRGRTLPERGLDRYSPPVRKCLTLLAPFATFNCLIVVFGNLPTILSPNVGVPAHLPAHLINGQCGAPGYQRTRYGPCPGRPDFRMPGRTTRLQGRDLGD